MIITHLDLALLPGTGGIPESGRRELLPPASALALSAAQMTLVISEDVRREIIDEFGLPIGGSRGHSGGSRF